MQEELTNILSYTEMVIQNFIVCGSAEAGAHYASRGGVLRGGSDCPNGNSVRHHLNSTLAVEAEQDVCN